MRALAAMGAFVIATAAAAAETSFGFGRFGKVAVLPPPGAPGQVAIFVSGDGGWNAGVVDMARELAAMDTLVLGVDIVHYLKELGAAGESCVYPAADFEALSQYAQKRLGLERYHPPVLVGYSSGATLVYALAVQAPPGTFRAAISLGFCPDLEFARPFCRGHGLTFKPMPKRGRGVIFDPSASVEIPWIALQGLVDQVCDPAGTRAFVARVTGGEIVELPKVGHGYSVPRNWLPQFREAFRKVTPVLAPGPRAAISAPGHAAVSSPEAAPSAVPPALAAAVDVSDLPLVQVAASGTPRPLRAIVISGDGGWAGIDREISAALAAQGVAVVGLNTLQYLWKAKTPDIGGRDLERIVRSAVPPDGDVRVLLIGYSLGADILPFMAARLPADLASRVAVAALLGPSPTVSFEFHLGDWIGAGCKDEFPVGPEVGRLSGMRLLCVYGSEEADSLCPSLATANVEKLRLQGAHHFGGDYRRIAEAILRAASTPSAAGTPR